MPSVGQGAGPVLEACMPQVNGGQPLSSWPPSPISKTVVTPKPLHKMAASPEPLYKMAAIHEPSAVMATTAVVPSLAVPEAPTKMVPAILPLESALPWLPAPKSSSPAYIVTVTNHPTKFK